GDSEGQIEADFVIDASGQRGVVASKYKLRKFDEYYRNMAVWSYWKGGKRYGGDLNGVTFSIAFKEGWIWMIPLKEDIYSVGVVTGVEAAKDISANGPEAFYRRAVAECEEAVEILGDAKMVDQVRVVRDWAYSSNQMSVDQAFMCGDAACFIDPLFSQGVHLATYSAMLASAGIDYLYQHPEARDAVHAWYSHSYREAYQRYHRFLTAFYACTNEPESTFWKSRKITDASDERLQSVEWFAAITNNDAAANAEGIRQIEERAGTLAYLWRHTNDGLHDDFDEKELSLRRVAWANELVKSFKRCATIKWKHGDVMLVPSFKVHTTDFHLEPRTFLGDSRGRILTAIPVTDEHRQVFARLATEMMGYRELTQALKEIDPGMTPLHLVGRLFEEGFIEGFDREGNPIKITSALRFGGVGAEDDLS
ncbi:MAG TPA: tryptophan 7-halogenase, partial [Rhodothermales bacterium]